MSIGSNEAVVSPFNSPVELGFRTLVLLNEAFPKKFSLRQLVIFDYLMVHSDDVSGGPAGLHPQTPYRSGELLVRREPLQAGIELFHSRGLIEELYRATGVFFCSERSHRIVSRCH
ncbi:MAG: ABC-three component system middle component 2 [Pirellulaceae bacterium]